MSNKATGWLWILAGVSWVVASFGSFVWLQSPGMSVINMLLAVMNFMTAYPYFKKV